MSPLIVLLTIGYGVLALFGFILTTVLWRRRRTQWNITLSRAKSDDFTATRLRMGLARDATLIFHWIYARTFLALGGAILAGLSVANQIVWHSRFPWVILVTAYFLTLFYATEIIWDYLALADLLNDRKKKDG